MEVNPLRLDGKRDRFSSVKSQLKEKVSNMETFEDLLLKRLYYRGENRLDLVLKSLLSLIDLCGVETIGDRTILIDSTNFRRKVFKGPRDVKDRFLSLRKQKKKTFSYSEFAIANSIPYDTICGEFPIVFRDYRRTIHCLRLSYAFYLTMVMTNHVKFTFPNRVRQGHFKKVNTYLSEIFVHLYCSLRREKITDEKKIIKCFKNSLCYHVSQCLDQKEFPEGQRMDLIPIAFRPYFRKLEPDQKIRFFFSLLQSKELCEEVPESFVQETLEKHRDQLSSPHPGVQPETLEYLRTRGREFGKLVKKFYDPSKGSFPSNKATCHFPRNRGGVKGDLVFHERLVSGLSAGEERIDRMEPMVIGLFGQPGQGKSRFIPQLLSTLKKNFPGISREDLTYVRTCNVEFWDGYKGQPIVILDDLGQSTSGKDIQEFQTLVSCNPYILPMAELSDKGTYFVSPIIIATSNLSYGTRLSQVYESSPIIDDASFWRRFHVPLYCETGLYYQLDADPCWIRLENLLFESQLNRENLVRRNASRNDKVNDKTFFQQKIKFHMDVDPRISAKQKTWNPIPIEIDLFASELNRLFSSRRKTHENISVFWNQKIHEDFDTTESLLNKEFFSQEINPFLPESLGREDLFKESQSTTLNLRFDAFPPVGPLPVRVEPIREALKVRTITAGIGDTFCLKPFQRAMWKALGLEKQFCLTHGTNQLDSAIKRIYEQSSPHDVWISGDYTAATDSFAIEASKALLDGILESIDHLPTKRWALKEVSPHQLIYPESSGLEPVIQKSGQLMGSLLSFPLLCLLNDCTASAIGLSPDQYLINGDDILMRTHPDNYQKWKSRVQEFGLSLSLGKNYIHSEYGTVNSQLVHKDKVVDSGKQKVLDRRSRVLGECLRDLERLMRESPSEFVHDIFKQINRKKLSRTIRSINVPSSHGGLALDWGNRENLNLRSLRTEILVYLHDLFIKIKPRPDHISIPYLSWEKVVERSNERMELTFQEPETLHEFHEDFLNQQAIPVVKKRLMSNSDLRHLFLEQKIEDLPPLSFLSSIQIPFSDSIIRKELQGQIDRAFFRLFLDGNSGFEYEDYKTLVNIKTSNPETSFSEKKKFLISMMDLNVKPDFLSYIPCSYQAKRFDLNIFKKQLGRSLEPKEFDLPDIQEGTVDYSLEVERLSKEQLQLFVDSWENESLDPQIGFSKVLSELSRIMHSKGSERA